MGLWVIVLGILGYGWLTDFRTLSAGFIVLVVGLALSAEIGGCGQGGVGCGARPRGRGGGKDGSGGGDCLDSRSPGLIVRLVPQMP